MPTVWLCFDIFCGWIIIYGFMWLIYPYPSGLLHRLRMIHMTTSLSGEVHLKCIGKFHHMASLSHWSMRSRVACSASIHDPALRRHPTDTLFRVTGHLCGEFTGRRWIPRTKATEAELCDFFDLRLNKRLSKQSWGWWFETPSHPLWRHCNETNWCWLICYKCTLKDRY